MPDNASAQPVLLADKEYTMDDGSNAYSAVFSSRALLRRGRRRPHTATVLKIATDATYRDLFGTWCMIVSGFLSKQYGQTRDGGHKIQSWASHLSELVFVVSCGECNQAYELGFDIVKRLPLAASVGEALQEADPSIHAGNVEAVVSRAHAAGEGQAQEMPPATEVEAVASRAHAESDEHALEMLPAAAACAEDKVAALPGGQVRQVHGDWARSLEVARKRCFQTRCARQTSSTIGRT